MTSPRPPVSGRGRFWAPSASGLLLPGPWSHNEFLYEWAPAAARLFGLGDLDYRIGALYVEYENVDAPEDEIEAPTFGRTGGKSYFDGLADHASKDYLRVPVKYTAFDTSDATLFSQPNIVSFAGSTAGTTGQHGKPFSAAANSKIYGIAAVVTPDFLDPSADLVFDRLYKVPADQVVKPTNSQITVEIEVTFN